MRRSPRKSLLKRCRLSPQTGGGPQGRPQGLSSLLVVVCCLVSLVVSTPARAVVWRNDLSEADVLELAQQGQFHGTGVVSAGGSSGTGVAIAPGWVLSARHFLPNNSNVTFRLAQRDATGSPIFDGNGDVVMDNYAGTVITRPGNDLALIQLNANAQLPSSTPFISPNPGLPTQNELVWKVGAGRFGSRADVNSAAGLNSGNRLNRAGTNIVQSTFEDLTVNFPDGTSYDVGPALAMQRNDSGPFETRFEVTTAPGDSGGPTYLQHNNQWYVAGTTFGAVGGVGFVEADVAGNLDWIQTTTGITFPAATDGPNRIIWDRDAGTAGVQVAGGDWFDDRPDFHSTETGFNYTWENDYAPVAVFGQAGQNAAVVRVADDFVVSGIEFAPNASTGPFQLNAGGGTLTAAAGGATIQVDQFAALQAPLAGSETFTKTGDGDLILNGDNAAFTGQLVLQEGRTLVNNGMVFGTDGFNANTKTTVADGATLALRGTGATTSEHFHISGDGVDGQGAIRALAINANNGGDHVFTERISLQEDATITADANTSITFGGDAGLFYRPGNLPIGETRGLTQMGEGTVVYDNVNNINSLAVVNGVVAGVGGINGSVTLTQGADLRPGDSALSAEVGTFRTDDLLIDMNSMLTIDLDAASGAIDLVMTDGIVNVLGALNLNLLSAPTMGESYIFLQNDGADSVIGRFANDQSIVGSFGGQLFDFDVSYIAGTGNDIAFTFGVVAVPEPSTWLALSVMSIAAAHRLRRRRCA